MKIHGLVKFQKVEDKSIVSSALGIPYPARRFIAFEGEPKTGKTILAVQDALFASKYCDVLYVYNETTCEMFMDIVWNIFNYVNQVDPKLDEIDYRITFLELNVDENGNPFCLPANANRQMVNFLAKRVADLIVSWIIKSKEPKLVFIDSITQFASDAPAQTGAFVKHLYYLLHSIFTKTQKYPCVVAINQVVDNRAFGGFKVAHAYDGIVSFKKYRIDKFTTKQFNLPLGTLLFTASVEGIRAFKTNLDEFIVNYEKGLLKRGKFMYELTS
ncbi:ATPase domain-containing protein [Caldisericum sp.]|uniref:ATPase domain-containing protein n=1 Tax=Caldisericum sp. TaxID=2499687 RepID=UPI003D0C580D